MKPLNYGMIAACFWSEIMQPFLMSLNLTIQCDQPGGITRAKGL